MGQFISEMPASQTTISYKKLLDNGLIKENEHNCDGYVFIKKNLATFDYKAYIKCDKYTTKDFDESKVEKWKKSSCYLLVYHFLLHVLKKDKMHLPKTSS